MKKVVFEVNGHRHEVHTGKDEVLLDFLRDSLDLIGAKQSCDRKGQCGACTVIVDGKAKPSCLVKLKNLDGSSVITVEGLGTPDNPHLIQHAYVLTGAIQCGFCTPGLIMATKALLDKNADPDDAEIKKALKNNLCRCTGYVKIIEAVKLAGRFLRGEITPEEVAPKPEDGIIGVSHPRPSSMAKACGQARFAADFKLSGALEIAVLRSEIPHAEIKSIDFAEAEAMPGVAGVMTASDIKGTNRLKMIMADRPVLCDGKVRYIGDPIALVAAETKEQAEAAAKAVKVELQPLEVMQSPQQAMADGAPEVHEGTANLCAELPQIKGDADAALAESKTVVEASFTTQINHQAALEPEATVAYWNEEEDPEDPVLVVVGRSINIHTHLGMLQEALGFENMCYEEAYTGGQFGIKIDVVSEGLCAAAALHFKRAVRYIPGLHESLLMSPKRHPFQMQIKLAADQDGKLTAFCNDMLVDNGAYYSIGHVVIYRALQMLSGSYNIPAIKANGKLVYTNNPWGAAARGAGPPQANFALECAMDMLAEKLEMDPFDLRLNNLLKPGETKSTGRSVTEWPVPGLMEAIRPHYERAKQEAAHTSGPIQRGVGLATGSFGVGGAGDSAVAAVELDEDGGVTIYAAVADPGEGNDSMLTQITAEAMGIPMDMVRLHTRRSDETAASGPSAGSRITYMLGGAVLNALEQLKQAMQETKAKSAKELAEAGKPVRYLGRKKNQDDGPPADPKTGQGPSFESQVHAVQMVELEVDTTSGAVKILKMTTAVDAGTVINPNNLTGQLEGGADMGVGYALREEYVAGESKDWRTFKFPTIADSFEQEVITIETPRPNGPMGATGVGEMCLVPTAPAVINGINNAVGVYICDLPATPEKIMAALQAK